MDFPFKELFEMFAKPLCEMNMKGKGFHPSVNFIKVEEDGVRVSNLPLEISSGLVIEGGMDKAFELFKNLVNKSSDNFGIVMVVMGSILKLKTKDEFSEEQITEYVKSLDTDGEGFHDCMAMTIFHKSGNKMLHFLILEDGTIEYQEYEELGGDARFVSVSEEERQAASVRH